jgi:hypothetical protein
MLTTHYAYATITINSEMAVKGLTIQIYILVGEGMLEFREGDIFFYQF